MLVFHNELMVRESPKGKLVDGLICYAFKVLSRREKRNGGTIFRKMDVALLNTRKKR